MATDFTEIPILDVSHAKSPETKAQLLADLQDALVRVGFLYVKNHSIPEEVEREVITS
jgi:isopenicillin N synthase-like dioxygenase